RWPGAAWPAARRCRPRPWRRRDTPAPRRSSSSRRRRPCTAVSPAGLSWATENRRQPGGAVARKVRAADGDGPQEDVAGHAVVHRVHRPRQLHRAHLEGGVAAGGIDEVEVVLDGVEIGGARAVDEAELLAHLAI